MGTFQLMSLKVSGFQGRIYPVHPREEKVLDLKAYRSVLDLPEVPDLAVLVIPTRIVPAIIEECGQKGIRHVIVTSGGFREVGGEGIELERLLVEAAGKYGIRFIGPNCIGAANPHLRFVTTVDPYDGPPGFIGMASQSGSFVTQMFDYLSRSGLGFSTAISVGNEANIDLVDCLEYLYLCPNTRAIALYVETIRRGRAFLETARRISRHKPIVAFYVGGTDAGKKASFSHTASMAGPDRLYEGLFNQAGIIRAYSIEELFDFCWVLGSCHMPSGNRVIIQTHSGGPGVAMADACGREGLDLASLDAETRDKLGRIMPHTGSLDNPVDLTFSKNPLDYFSKIPSILMEEEGADGLLMYFITPKIMIRGLELMGVPKDEVQERTRQVVEAECGAISQLVLKGRKPLIGYTYRTRDDPFIREMQDRGIPVLPGPRRAARAMAALHRYGKMRSRILENNS
jgi:acyl-CoA synthetase (NDP forming)